MIVSTYHGSYRLLLLYSYCLLLFVVCYYHFIALALALYFSCLARFSRASYAHALMAHLRDKHTSATNAIVLLRELHPQNHKTLPPFGHSDMTSSQAGNTSTPAGWSTLAISRSIEPTFKLIHSSRGPPRLLLVCSYIYARRRKRASSSPTKQTDSAILAALHRGYKPGGEYSASLYPQSPLRGQQMQCLDIVSVT